MEEAWLLIQCNSHKTKGLINNRIKGWVRLKVRAFSSNSNHLKDFLGRISKQVLLVCNQTLLDHLPAKSNLNKHLAEFSNLLDFQINNQPLQHRDLEEDLLNRHLRHN